MASTPKRLEPRSLVYVDETGTEVARGTTFDFVFRGAVIAFTSTGPLYEVVAFAESSDRSMRAVLRVAEEW